MYDRITGVSQVKVRHEKARQEAGFLFFLLRLGATTLLFAVGAATATTTPPSNLRAGSVRNIGLLNVVRLAHGPPLPHVQTHNGLPRFVPTGFRGSHLGLTVFVHPYARDPVLDEEGEMEHVFYRLGERLGVKHVIDGADLPGVRLFGFLLFVRDGGIGPDRLEIAFRVRPLVQDGRHLADVAFDGAQVVHTVLFFLFDILGFFFFDAV